MTVKRLIEKKTNKAAHISPETWVAGVLKRLQNDDISAIVVSSDGWQIEGIVSERDVVRALSEYGSRIFRLQVADIMTEEVITCSISESAHSVMEKMDAFHIRHIPVVNDKTHFVGMLSIRDIVKDRLDDAEIEQHHMRNYISGNAA